MKRGGVGVRECASNRRYQFYLNTCESNNELTAFGLTFARRETILDCVLLIAVKFSSYLKFVSMDFCFGQYEKRC